MARSEPMTEGSEAMTERTEATATDAAPELTVVMPVWNEGERV